MLTTCAYVYESGKTCGRIPRRGESLCRDHRNRIPPRARFDFEAFKQSLFAACDRYNAMPFDDMLLALQQDLNELLPLVENKASSSEYFAYNRATMAVASAIDRYELEKRAAATFIDPQGRTVPPLSIEQLRGLEQWADQICAATPSNPEATRHAPEMPSRGPVLA